MKTKHCAFVIREGRILLWDMKYIDPDSWIFEADTITKLSTLSSIFFMSKPLRSEMFVRWSSNLLHVLQDQQNA